MLLLIVYLLCALFVVLVGFCFFLLAATLYKLIFGPNHRHESTKPTPEEVEQLIKDVEDRLNSNSTPH